jgi:hypothetical protein
LDFEIGAMKAFFTTEVGRAFVAFLFIRRIRKGGKRCTSRMDF